MYLERNFGRFSEVEQSGGVTYEYFWIWSGNTYEAGAESQAIGAEMKVKSIAIELFKAGVSIETIAKSAKVNLETIQQWLVMNEDTVDTK